MMIYLDVYENIRVWYLKMGSLLVMAIKTEETDKTKWYTMNFGANTLCM